MSTATSSFDTTIQLRRKQASSLMDSYLLACKHAHVADYGDVAYLHLKQVIGVLIFDIERDGAQKAWLDLEPAYHNRQHFADAMLAMGLFLEHCYEFDDYEKQLLLLVMLAHDFGHSGLGCKTLNSSHEDETVALLKATPLMTLPPEDIYLIQECILGTKPENIEKIYQECRSGSLDHSLYMSALVNDADIAASFVDPLGKELSHLILLEQGELNPSDDHIQHALDSFRASAKISSPIARQMMGIEEWTFAT